MVRRTASGYSAAVNVYLVFGAVEAGFLNLWIIGYAVMLLPGRPYKLDVP